MRTITFFNNKGGVGKTTTIVNLAAYLSKYKKKRMVILDLDPQSNSNTGKKRTTYKLSNMEIVMLI